MRKPEELLKILDGLTEGDFEKFKWHLKQPGNLEGYDVISEARLEKADRKDTVDVMVKTYKIDGCLEVTKTVLKKVGCNNLVEELSQGQWRWGALGDEVQLHKQEVRVASRIVNQTSESTSVTQLCL